MIFKMTSCSTRSRVRNAGQIIAGQQPFVISMALEIELDDMLDLKRDPLALPKLKAGAASAVVEALQQEGLLPNGDPFSALQRL